MSFISEFSTQFPEVLELQGHFVDKKGVKWIVDIPQSVLEVHVHQGEEQWDGPIYWVKDNVSTYCLRLIKDEQGAVLKIRKDESSMEE